MATFHSEKNVQDAETVQCRPEYRKGKAYNRRFRPVARRGQIASLCCGLSCQCRHHCKIPLANPLWHSLPLVFLAKSGFCGHNECKKMFCEYTGGQIPQAYTPSVDIPQDLRSNKGQQPVVPSLHLENSGQNHNFVSRRSFLGPRSDALLTRFEKNDYLRKNYRDVLNFLRQNNISFNTVALLEAILDVDGSLCGKTKDALY